MLWKNRIVKETDGDVKQFSEKGTPIFIFESGTRIKRHGWLDSQYLEKCLSIHSVVFFSLDRWDKLYLQMSAIMEGKTG